MKPAANIASRLLGKQHIWGWLTISGLIICVLLWRSWSASWVLAVSAAVLGIALLMAWRLKGAAHWSVAFMALATIVAPLIHFESLWPCELACSGATYYSTLGGIPAWALGMIAYGATMACGILALISKQPAIWHLFGLTLALCLGVSLWFIWLSWSIEIICGHCLALHTIVIAATLGAWRILPLAQWLLLAALGGLGIHVAFHPQLARDHQDSAEVNAPYPPPANELQPADPKPLNLARQAMTLGNSDAIWQADLLLDPLCPHCRVVWLEVANQLGPLVGSGDLAIRIRIRHNPRLPLSRFAGEMLVASAFDATLPSALPQLVGLNQRDSIETVRKRWELGNFQPQRADFFRAMLPELINRVLLDDLNWLRANQLLSHSTPILQLHNPNQQRQIWSGNFDLAEVVEHLTADRE